MVADILESSQISGPTEYEVLEWLAMELVLIVGIILTAIGILVGLYMPVLVSHFATPEKVRAYAIAGAALVLVGTACEVFAIWPMEVQLEQSGE